MRRFVAPGLRTLPSGTSSGWRRTPGTSTIRTRCPALGRLTVQKRSLVSSWTGSSEVCGGLPKVRRIRSPKRMKVGRLLQRAIPRRNRTPEKRSLMPAQTRMQSRDRLKLSLHRNRKRIKERIVTRLLLGAAPTAARCLDSHSTKGYSLRLCLSIDRPRTPA